MFTITTITKMLTQQKTVFCALLLALIFLCIVALLQLSKSGNAFFTTSQGQNVLNIYLGKNEIVRTSKQALQYGPEEPTKIVENATYNPMGLNSSLEFLVQLLLYSKQIKKERNEYFLKIEESYVQRLNAPYKPMDLNRGSDFLVLSWTGAEYQYYQDYARQWDDDKQFCPEQRCKFTSNRSAINTADVILFSLKFLNLRPTDRPPAQLRTQRQKYVLLGLECPLNTKGIPGPADIDFFNWTMSYRRDSDIWTPYYGYFQKIHRTGDENLIQEWMEIKTHATTSKTHLVIILVKNKKTFSVFQAVWIVSHCETVSKRMNYFLELQKHIHIDMFGGCASLFQEQTLRSFDNSFDKQSSNLISKYKFFIAFENCQCKHWITEKFFEKINHFSVPIVLNRQFHKELVPDSSFIAADDFSSPRHLAEYLNYLDKNITAYLEYFKWRMKWRSIYRSPWLCELCKKLWTTPKDDVSIVKDYGRWWHSNACIPSYGEVLLNNQTNSTYP